MIHLTSSILSICLLFGTLYSFQWTGCSSKSSDSKIDGSQESSLTQTEWNLQTINGEPLIPGSDGSLRFDEDEVHGSGGCNSFGGEYQVRDSSLTINELFWTEMACFEPEGILQQESTYMQWLGRVDAFQLTEGTLELLSEGSVVLTFTQNTPEPDAELLGSTWKLDTFLLGEVATTPLANHEVTIQFEANTFQGTFGCGTFTGQYSLKGSVFQVTELDAPLLDCSEEIKEDASRFVSILQSCNTLRIEGARLQLDAPDNQGLHFHIE